MPEVDAERIDPEAVGVLRVADGDVAGDAFVEPESGEQAERRRQALLAVAPLLLEGRESGRRREVFGSSGSFSHR